MKTHRFKLSVFALVALVAASSVVRAELITTLVTPSQPVQAGSSIVVEVAYLNPGDTPQNIVNIATWPGTFTLNGRSWAVELHAPRGTDTVVGPNGFILHSYTIALPESGSGHGTLHITGAGAAALNGAIEVVGPESLSDAPQAAVDDEATRTLHVEEADSKILGRTFARRLNIHNPIYFVYGGGDQAAKFQLSFKYRVATFGENVEKRTLSTLQFGYTQRSLWDINSSSSPFYDTSYMPELFWEWYKLPKAGETNRGSLLGFQSGILHESNGRAGDESRSLNSAFTRVVFTFGSYEGWNLKLMPEAWIYGSLDENEPIDEYRGNMKLVGIFGKADGIALRFSLSPGKNFDRLTSEFDLTVPLRVRLLDLAAFFQVQYFNGYGESLLSYNKKSDALRVGVALSR
jgi:outer membrane phospholipase A